MAEKRIMNIIMFSYIQSENILIFIFNNDVGYLIKLKEQKNEKILPCFGGAKRFHYKSNKKTFQSALLLTKYNNY